MEHTVLLATLLYKDLDEYTHSACHLLPHDAAALLGVSLSSGDLMDADGMPRWVLAPPTAAANFSKAAVDSWLQRLLLAVVRPPLRPPEQRARESCPLNISSLFRAVERLQQLGCPPHWLQTFCTSLLRNELVTAHTPPKRSPNPCTAAVLPAGSKVARVDLSSCLLEARAVAALWLPRLGPCLALAAASLPPPSSVKQHTLSLHRLPPPATIWMMGTPMASFVAGLLLADGADPTVSEHCKRLTPYLCGQMGSNNAPPSVRRMVDKCPAGSVHLISCMHWNHISFQAQVYLPDETMEMMQAPGSKWVATAFRTDSWTPFTAVTPLART